MSEGQSDRSTDESVEGSTDESVEGSTDESVEGSTDESVEGSTDESVEGSTERSVDAADATPNQSIRWSTDGSARWASPSGSAPPDGDGGGDGGSLLTRPTDWPLAYHTVRNMTGVQLAGIAERRLRHAVVPRLPIDFDARYAQRVPAALRVTTEPIRENLSRLRASLSDAERDRFRTAAAEAAAGRYAFLDRPIDLGVPIDWDDERIDREPLFWRLKLEGFESFEWLALGWESPTADEAAAIRPPLLEQGLAWNEARSIGEHSYLRRSWIPHSVSLRVLHWSRYVAWCAGEGVAVPDRLLAMIYKNALFLDNHVEREVGGNHLIENAVALVVAGVLFREHDTGWVRTGAEILKDAARTQFLRDGGHFERSPMYHVTVLRRYITAIDLLSSAGRPTVALDAVVGHALGFLRSLVAPSGRIPLLNDSVHEESIEAASCLSYARACSLSPTARSLAHPDGSGYRLLPSASGTLLVDVGDVGPPHLPAHSHNDQLSVLLWIDGGPVLTDTGVYDYGSNPRRNYARSVAAHNTVQYGKIEPIPIGRSYLMGKRSSVDVIEETAGFLEARHARSRVVGASYEHRRTVSVDRDEWLITDRVTGDPDETYTARYHVHPDIDVREREGDRFVVSRAETDLATLSASGASDASVDRSPYFEAYGRERMRPVISLRADVGSALRTRITTIDSGT
ncbi:heparinase II/III domain-containing protein [Halorubrum sp. DTA46]|uniref:heparinase II/III domain-containing protein n=1 Tax=Halorubrum sp. DTA46 TaxID=3402162 RepID=UPI003AAB46B7